MAFQDDEFLQSLLAAFAIEAAEHTQALSDLLLRLEEGAGANDPSLIEGIYREAHSLKGAARAVNQFAVESVCQALENVFASWKKGQITSTPELFDALHQGVDAITNILSTQDDSLLPVAGIAERIQRLGQKQGKAKESNESASSENSSTLESFSPYLESQREATPEIETWKAPSYETLSPLSFLVADEEPESFSTNVTSPATATQQEIETDTSPQTTLSEPQHPSAEPPAPPTAPAPVGVSPTAPSPTASRPASVANEETVRVATSRLDGMLLQAEEMLLVKQATLERATELNRITTQFGLWRKEWNKILPDFQAAGGEEVSALPPASLKRMLDFLEWNRAYVQTMEEQIAVLARATEVDKRATGSLVDNLLNDAKKLLMLPFSHLVGIFPKMVRDLARHQEKDLTLDIQGSEVQIDKRILEELKDPLIHLLRNSVDHGIESPQERVDANKPPTATIGLRMIQKSGSEVEVRVSDDGRGINTKAVKASAVKNGLVSPEKADQLSEAEAFDLIFQSSLSTSPIITEISGRGLGMAIVREKVEKLGGTIEVESRLGIGTTFCITLPLTLATFRGVLVEVHEQIFVLPATEVERVVRVPLADVRRVHNRDTITLPRANRKERLRDRDVIPFISLAEVLELGRHPQSTRERQELRIAVILAEGEQRIALDVDAVLAEQEVLVKPFSRPLVRVRNVAGATILASGKAAPILNVSDILASSLRYIHSGQGNSLGLGGDQALSETGDDDSQQKSILVAEDSITSRMLLKNILESAGYQVTTAVDGLDALTTLRSGKFDLVVSDIDMPRLNGLDFTAKIREDSQFSELPVILVTARSTREDRERGIDVGANAYIVKSTFNQNDLLEVVQRLI